MIIDSRGLSKGSHKLALFKCDNCGKEFEREYKGSCNSKQHFCCKECKYELMHKKQLEIFESKINEDAYDFLYREYITNQKTTREISEMVYGTSKNSPNISKWIQKLKIPLRHGSEAVKTQWIGQKAIDRGMNPHIDDSYREITRNIEGYDDFIKSVYNRDNYTCQCCGDNKGGNLVVHHLNGYNWDIEHRTDPDNGVTLCKDCHKKFHSIYKYGNNTKSQYDEFINNANKTA